MLFFLAAEHVFSECNAEFLLVSPVTFILVTKSRMWWEKLSGRARSGQQELDMCWECSGIVPGVLPQGVHPEWTCINCGQLWVHRWCLRGVAIEGGNLKTNWFYSANVKRDFKDISEQKLTVWNIWMFFKQSDLLTSIQEGGSLLRCCFQAWYKSREAYFWKENDSFEVSAPPSWVVQVLPEMTEGKRFKQRAKACLHETWGTFLCWGYHLMLVESFCLTLAYGLLVAVIYLCL